MSHNTKRSEEIKDEFNVSGGFIEDHYSDDEFL